MLVYDGLLAEQVLQHCVEAANEGFRYVIETCLPPHEGWDKNLTDRTWFEPGSSDYLAHEDRAAVQCSGKISKIVRRDAGRHYPQDSNRRYNGGTFVFLLDHDDYKTALLALKETVVSEAPFKTVFGFGI
jgi:hypothetical protein